MSFSIFYKLLNTKQKINFWTLTFLSIIIVFFELLSIGLVIPLISIILDPQIILDRLLKFDITIFNNIEHTLINKNFIFYFLIFFVLLYAFKNLLIFLINYYLCKFVETIETSFSHKIINNYLSQKYPFFSKNTSSSLITKLSVDFLNFTRGYINQTIIIFSEVLIIISFTILIIVLDLHKVGLVFLIFFIIGAILMRIIGNYSNKWGKKRKFFDHLKIEILNNTFQNIKNVIIDNKKDVLVKNFDLYVKELASLQKKIVATKVLPKSIFEIFGIASLSAVIVTMTLMEYDKNEILTSTGFFVAVAYRIVPSFQKIIYSYQTISLSKIVLYSIEKDFGLDNNVSSDDERISFKKQIDIGNLVFKYSKKEIIDGLNLKIKKGEAIGIYGDSGIGKSTLVDIISGLLPFQNGFIKIDDFELNNEELIRKWQNQISYVTQNTTLFNDSIKNNIIFSSNSTKVDEERLNQVIINTQLSDFISSLPDKINTSVGEMGNKLSGGQKKRIGIARALYKNPELLIFDEATNGLDKETENKILSMIFKFKEDKTLIIISHDLNVLKNTDKIYQFVNGKLNFIDEINKKSN